MKEFLLEKGVLAIDRLSLMFMEPLSELTGNLILFNLLKNDSKSIWFNFKNVKYAHI